MKPFLLFRTGKTRVLIVVFSIAAFFTLALQCPTTSQAAPGPTPKSPTSQYRVFLPMVVRDPLPLPPGSKKGVAMPWQYRDCADVKTMGAVWQYDWTAQPVDCPGVDNVSMIWGADYMNATITGTSQWLMGFNEPDLPEQSNIPVATAVVAWHQIEQKYPDRKLVAPAPSHVHPNWIVDFRNAYITQYGKPPRLDALAMHCYYPTAAECIQLGKNFESWAQAWGVKEIWVTEFAFLSCVLGTSDKAVGEGQMMMNWIENEPMFTRMAWFASRIQGTEPWAMTCNSPLFDWNTRASTSFGTMYAPYR